MQNNKHKILLEAFKKAGATGSKLHIMALDGKWVIFKERSNRILSKYATRRSAIFNAKKMLNSQKDAEALIIHKTDGSVDKYLLAS